MLYIVLILSVVPVLTKIQSPLQVHDIAPYPNDNSISNIDLYVNFYREQYRKNIEEYDRRLDEFLKPFKQQIETISVQRELLIKSIVQNEDRLNPLELLNNDSNNECIVNNNQTIPTIEEIECEINTCSVIANNQITNITNGALNTRYALEDFYLHNFESQLKDCNWRYDNGTTNYTACIFAAIAFANEYTLNNQRYFETQLAVAECSVKAFIQEVLACVYDVQSKTITALAEANDKIDRCIVGKNECSPCVQGPICAKNNTVQAGIQKEFIPNPFYGIDDIPNCFALYLGDVN